MERPSNSFTSRIHVSAASDFYAIWCRWDSSIAPRLTDRVINQTISLLQAGAQHRGHAVAEQVFADWTDGPMAHLPSGSFPANAAWLALAALSGSLVAPLELAALTAMR